MNSVARQVGINESTLRKAIKRQAIPELPKAPECAQPEAGQLAGSTKSERSRDDAQAALGAYFSDRGRPFQSDRGR